MAQKWSYYLPVIPDYRDSDSHLRQQTELSPDASRHLTASVLDGMGIPIGTIQRILGHQNRKTTEIHLHSVGDAERKAMDRL